MYLYIQTDGDRIMGSIHEPGTKIPKYIQYWAPKT